MMNRRKAVVDRCKAANIRTVLTRYRKRERTHVVLHAIDELLAWVRRKCPQPAPVQSIMKVVACYRQDECVKWINNWTEDGGATDPIVSGMNRALTALDDLGRLVIPCQAQERYSDFLFTHQMLRNPDPPNFIPDTVEEFLQKRVAQMDPTPLPRLRYSSMEQFVLQKGKHYPKIKLPTGYPKLPSGSCYANAKLLAKRCSLTYVEGFALLRHYRWPQFHGWNLDESGRVIDSTWEDAGRDYFGVEIDRSLVMNPDEFDGFVNFSILDRPDEWPFLK